MHLEDFQCLLDQLTQIETFLLAVVDGITDVALAVLKDVEHRQNLTIVRNQGLTNHLARENKRLQNLQYRCDYLPITGVQGRLDRNDELRNHGQDLAASTFKHVVGTLDSQESIRVLPLSEAIEEDGQIMVVVELVDIDLLKYFVRGARMLHLDG